MALAIYGTLLREADAPFAFPGTEAAFGSLFQVVDADLLAEAAIHLATAAGAGNQAYNVSNGDIFRWRNLWPRLAGCFGLEPAGPSGGTLGDFLAERQAAWERIAHREGLRALPYAEFPGWLAGDYQRPNSRLACEHDLFADTVKLRQAGFARAQRSDDMFLRLFERFAAERVIPARRS